MIRIIDATLCQLEHYNLEKEQIYCFIALMGKIGIRELQISKDIYDRLSGEPPQGYTYYLEVGTVSYTSDAYPRSDQISYYFIPRQANAENEIAGYQINDPEEPVRVQKRGKASFTKVTGVNNLLLSGCKAGLGALKKKFPFEYLILSPENTYHCASAIAVMFLQNKGYAAVTSMCGIGNKAATEQVIMAMHVIGRQMSNREFSAFCEIKIWMEEITEMEISLIAPVLGERIFYVESGIHVDGILKKPSNYEPYSPELVGLCRTVVLGKHSGKSAIHYKIRELNLNPCQDPDAEKLLERVKEETGKKGRTISDAEFIRIVEGYER